MATTTIKLVKLDSKDTEQGIKYSLKNTIITIPKNVIDADYFRQAVQYHIFDIGACNLNTSIYQATQKLNDMIKAGKDDSLAYSRAQDKRNELIKLESILKEDIKAFDSELSEEYEDITVLKAVFRSDSFAETYAWVLGGYSSKKVWKSGNEASKGKVDDIQFRFKNEDKITGLLKDFDFATTQEQKKASAKNIEQLANQLFSTNGGDVYKNVSFKFTAGKVNAELYTRFKKVYSHDGKGNIKDVENTSFDLCKQLFFMCLIQLGVPTINGQKLIYVDEIADCQQVIKVNRKKKADKGGESDGK